MTHIVAIDGPAGSGKSSVSKVVAGKLGFGYLDTGAAYRVLTWECHTRGVNLDDADAVVAVAQALDYASPLDPAKQEHVLGGLDVTESIRGNDVSQQVSAVAKHPRVRMFLNDGFRQRIDKAHYPGVIVEGRDITTVVFPDASVRILLTASEEVRIARREKELAGAGSGLSQRDQRDRKTVDFLNAAEGVHTVDSTDLSFDDTVAAVMNIISQHIGDANTHE